MISIRRSRNYWRINCVRAAADPLKHPGLRGIGIWRNIRGRFNRIGAEQFSRAAKQGTHLVELLLQRRISHGLTLPMPSRRHNSLSAEDVRTPVR